MTASSEWSGGPDRPKVFGIGMHKTSTTSLASALYLLGYSVGGYFDTGQFRTEAEIHEFAFRFASERDALQDVPWSVLYREVDERFPGSKFILTLRDPDRWVQSVVAHFGSKHIPTHEYIYGVKRAVGNEQVMLDYFHRHRAEVEDYFAERPDDLLVMDITTGDGWEVLCPFLGLSIPAFDFPRQNQAGGLQSSRLARLASRSLMAAAGPVGLGGLLTRGRVGGRATYRAVHELCRRCDWLVERAATGDLPEPAMAEARRWVADQIDFIAGHGQLDDAAGLRSKVEAGGLGEAWPTVRLAIRRWAGDLVDEGFGAKMPDGTDAAEPVRNYATNAMAHWTRVLGSLDLGDRELSGFLDGIGVEAKALSAV